MRWFVKYLPLGVAAVVACSSSSTSTPPADKPEDAGTDVTTTTPVADADVTPITDAGPTGDGCVPNVSTRDAGALVPLTNFAVVGSAAVDGTGVLLTPAMQNQAGALWRTFAQTFEHFDMTAGFSITPPNSTPADGMAFVFTSNASLPNIGDDGANLGVDGLPGYGVVIDEFGEDYPVAPPLVALVDLTKAAPGPWVITAQTIKTPVLDGNEHFLHVGFDAGVVTVHIDDELALDHAVIPSYTTITGRWGFGAGTGGDVAAHRITRVSFVDPSTNCQ